MRDYKGGGGIAVYVNSDFTCKCLPFQSTVVDELLESISAGHTNIIIICLCVTPGWNLSNFLDCLEQLFFELSVSKPIFVCGDYNLDMLKHNTNSDVGTNHFLDTVYSMCLCRLIDRPYRITNHSVMLIDNIFTNASNYDNAICLLISDISDHLPVCLLSISLFKTEYQ